MRVLRFLGWLSIVIGLAIGLAAVMGSRLPAEHTTSLSETIAAPQQRVWQLITDVAAQPAWRTGLKAVTPLASAGSAPCWAEVQSSMTMPLCADVTEAPTCRVVRITDPKLPFGGTWTYELQPAGEKTTRLTITEHGTTGPAIWRFIEHYVTGEDGQIRQYLTDLKRAAAQAA
jgi:Polyketide cyclase / dehydrase and lipid transport